MVDEVGYKRPPRHTQFQPGRSGNPRGRPKTKPTLAADLALELNQTTSVRDGGRERMVTKQRALVKALIDAAIAGDVRAATAVISLTAKVISDAAGDGEDGAGESLAPGDEAVIENFVQRELERRSSKGESPDDNTTSEIQQDQQVSQEKSSESETK